MRLPEACESVVVANGRDIKPCHSTDCEYFDNNDLLHCVDSRSDNGTELEVQETKSMASMSAIRDFFFTAFSDGYHNIRYCGCGESVKLINSSCNEAEHSTFYAGSPPQVQRTQTFSSSDCDEEERESVATSPISSSSTHVLSNIKKSPSSYSEGQRTEKRRPLAMSVQYKYDCVAKDDVGRPIVIMPTGSHHNSPIDLTDPLKLWTDSFHTLHTSWSFDSAF